MTKFASDGTTLKPISRSDFPITFSPRAFNSKSPMHELPIRRAPRSLQFAPAAGLERQFHFEQIAIRSSCANPQPTRSPASPYAFEMPQLMTLS